MSSEDATAGGSMVSIDRETRSANTAAEGTDLDTFAHQPLKSRRKLERFFGEQLPLDISLSEIETHGLKAILQSSVPQCYFLYCLLEELCAENLFFYIEVDQYEKMKFKSRRIMKTIGLQLYKTFVEPDSAFEINIDMNIRKPILEDIENNKQTCFRSAKEQIVKLMEPLFIKFKNSDTYERMRAELGDTCIYDKNAKCSAVKIILENLDKTLPDNEGHAHARVLPEAQDRNNMIRSMIHAFCETKLNIKFFDREKRVEPKERQE